MKRALINSGFTEEAESYLICLSVLAGESHPGRRRNLPANDCMAAEKIQLAAEQMHRAPFASRTAARLTIEFGHHGIRRHALGNRLAVLPITCQDVIVGTDGRNRADADGLLANIQVTETANLSQRVRLRALFFKAPNEKHLSKDV